MVSFLLEHGSERMSLTLVFRSDESAADLELHFRGVFDLRFRSEPFYLHQPLPVFRFENIRDRQWQKPKYRVTDVEEEFVSFYCRDVEVVS